MHQIGYVLQKQTKMANEFMKAKDEKHTAEDPDVLDALSDLFDIRNWNLNAFDPKSESNKETETQSQDFLFEKERKAMIQKMMSGSKFLKIYMTMKLQIKHIKF